MPLNKETKETDIATGWENAMTWKQWWVIESFMWKKITPIDIQS